ncbi:hypothetical protein [Aeromonas sobria]|uniref:hypothetical protein n=1 Tax=Aeromonas sobria TaxID=646 RepID=UPI000C6E57A6|nr:hypothetical protein [Aeromonas sobria]PKQ78092.1 hypothetical protein CJF47_07370 [Aeromonas sobria]
MDVSIIAVLVGAVIAVLAFFVVRLIAGADKTDNKVDQLNSVVASDRSNTQVEMARMDERIKNSDRKVESLEQQINDRLDRIERKLDTMIDKE